MLCGCIGPIDRSGFESPQIDLEAIRAHFQADWIAMLQHDVEQAGKPCATAKDMKACDRRVTRLMEDFDAYRTVFPRRFIVVLTRGDDVRVLRGPGDFVDALAPIGSPVEVLLVILSEGYIPSTEPWVRSTPDGYEVIVDFDGQTCLPADVVEERVLVRPNGELVVLEEAVVMRAEDVWPKLPE